jgi:hypothetical protein
MKKFIFAAFFVSCSVVMQAQEIKGRTFCNPVNLSYRFCLDEPSRREAADPSMVLFKNEYYLFASKSGGYFHSTDLLTWDLIVPEGLLIEEYAPTAVVIDNEIFFITSGAGSRKIFKTADPKSGKWQLVNDNFPFGATDPMLFLDDDGRVYYYWGCSDKDPIWAVELDRNNRLNPIGDRVVCIAAHTDKYGWEQPGDYNETDRAPWIEGAWMNRYNGKYYLQYAGPGTQFKSYADAVYVSDQPLGPFTLAKVNPFACKPEGFVTGAGHGSTFTDRYGNWWHIGTATISVKHMFERRLSLFPVLIDKDGEMTAYTGFGDYPTVIPDRKIADVKQLSTGWMLLSYNRKVETSSVLDGYPVQNAVNEDIRTYWSAETGNRGEFISIDLEKPATIHAVQINFAEQNTAILGRKEGICYRYLLEYSNNGKTWKMLADKSKNTVDAPHDYLPLKTPVKARYIRLTNVKVPDGNFAVSGLRVFGKCEKQPAKAVTTFKVDRQADRRVANLRWEKSPGAVGYNIRFGNQPDKLYQNYTVYDRNELVIRSLNVDSPYYFAVDAFNEAGIVEGGITKEVL